MAAIATLSAAKGVLPPYSPARDYQYQFVMRSDKVSRTDTLTDTDCYTEMTLTWGNAYHATNHGVRVEYRNWNDAGSATDNFSLILTGGMWGASYTLTGTGWDTEVKVRIEIDDLELETPDCDEWELRASELRLYLDDVLKYTVALTTETGTGYDVRENVVGIACQAIGNLFPTDALPICPGTDHTYHYTNSVFSDQGYDSGYRWAPAGTTTWHYDHVEIDNDEEAPVPNEDECGACGCTWPLPAIGIDSYHSDNFQWSWGVELNALWYQKQEVSATWRVTMYCTNPQPGDVPAIWDVWQIDFNFRYQTSNTNLAPANSPMRETLRTRTSNCYCQDSSVVPAVDTQDNDTTTGSFCYCESGQRVDRKVKRKYCSSIVQNAMCGLADPEEPPNDPPALPYVDTFCSYTGIVSITWPTEPPCTQAANWISYDVSDPRRHIIAFGDGSDLVWVARSPNTFALNFDGASIGITATAGCIRWHLHDLVLWTVETGSCKQRTSDDEGQSFSVATTIGAGTQVCGCISPQRVRYVYRRTSGGAIIAQILDAANNVIKSDTTVVASGVDDASISCDYRPLAGGKQEIVLWYLVGGSLIEKYSTDGFIFA